MSHVTLPIEISLCIDACESCHRVCVDSVSYCLTRGGMHAAVAHVRPLLDCAQICDTAKDFMLRGSNLHGGACQACADVCDACAASCEQFTGDAQMAACAQKCRSCASACRTAAGVRMPA